MVEFCSYGGRPPNQRDRQVGQRRPNRRLTLSVGGLDHPSDSPGSEMAPTASNYRTEIVDSRRPTKGPGQVADPQSFQTGVCRVQPSTPAGGRPVDPWAGRTLRPGQPDHLGARPYGPAGDTGPALARPPWERYRVGRLLLFLPGLGGRLGPLASRDGRAALGGLPDLLTSLLVDHPLAPRPTRRRRTPLPGPPGSRS